MVGGEATVERAGGAPTIATLRYVKNIEAREPSLLTTCGMRSEERRVGKEWPLGCQPRELVRRSDADVQVRNREVADLALEDVRRHESPFVPQ